MTGEGKGRSSATRYRLRSNVAASRRTTTTSGRSLMMKSRAMTSSMELAVRL